MSSLIGVYDLNKILSKYEIHLRKTNRKCFTIKITEKLYKLIEYLLEDYYKDLINNLRDTKNITDFVNNYTNDEEERKYLIKLKSKIVNKKNIRLFDKYFLKYLHNVFPDFEQMKNNDYNAIMSLACLKNKSKEVLNNLGIEKIFFDKHGLSELDICLSLIYNYNMKIICSRVSYKYFSTSDIIDFELNI
jgi:hypothetical protein